MLATTSSLTCLHSTWATDASWDRIIEPLWCSQSHLGGGESSCDVHYDHRVFLLLLFSDIFEFFEWFSQDKKARLQVDIGGECVCAGSGVRLLAVAWSLFDQSSLREKVRHHMLRTLFLNLRFTLPSTVEVVVRLIALAETCSVLSLELAIASGAKIPEKQQRLRRISSLFVHEFRRFFLHKPCVARSRSPDSEPGSKLRNSCESGEGLMRAVVKVQATAYRTWPQMRSRRPRYTAATGV